MNTANLVGIVLGILGFGVAGFAAFVVVYLIFEESLKKLFRKKK